MKYYHLSESSDLKLVGAYPQFRGGYYPVHSNDPRLILNRFFEKVNIGDTFTPVLKLAPKAILTDLMNGSATGHIISDKLKKIICEFKSAGIQFLEQIIIVKDIEIKGYWLTNHYQFDYNCIDFSKTTLSVMGNMYDEAYVTSVSDVNEFTKLINETKLPYKIRIKSLHFKEFLNEHFIVLRYVYPGFACYVSEIVKERLEKEKCTGIRFIELNEQI